MKSTSLIPLIHLVLVWRLKDFPLKVALAIGFTLFFNVNNGV